MKRLIEDKLKNLEDYADIFEMLDHAQKIVCNESQESELNSIPLTKLERKVLIHKVINWLLILLEDLDYTEEDK